LKKIGDEGCKNKTTAVTKNIVLWALFLVKIQQRNPTINMFKAIPLE